MGWNISLFHYRNHGAGEQTRAQVFPAIWSLITVPSHPMRFRSGWRGLGRSGGFLDLGKVLAGIQAPEEDSAQFGEFLRELGYPYVEETHNEVYRRYLRK